METTSTSTSTSWKLLRKCSEHDVFRRLPDEIIGSEILTRLSLKEAVQCSVLSRRWKNLWIQSIVGRSNNRLKFSYSRASNLHYTSSIKASLRLAKLRPIFESGINHVLEEIIKNKSESTSLDELTIQFDFDSSSYKSIDSWVEFALKNGVNHLELDLSPYTAGSYDREPYVFPSIEKLLLHQPVHCAAGLSNLRDVCFKFVDVPYQFIHLLLSDCPNLERLCLWSTCQWKTIKVTEKSVKLKTLEFVRASIAKIKISSPPNLMSLSFDGSIEALRITHAPPLLSELSIGDEYCRDFLRSGSQNFAHLSQLKKLKVYMSLEIVTESLQYPLEFPQLVKLEQLEVHIHAYTKSCVLWPILLIKAAPFLRKFSIKLRDMGKGKNARPKGDHLNNLQSATKLGHHQCLKLIEMQSFSGCKCEMEFIEHLLGISPSLEQLVIAETLYLDKVIEQLTAWLPPNTELVSPEFSFEPLSS